MLEIIKYPSKILRIKSRKVKNIFDSQFQKFIEDLKETMIKADGLGLAANQVNKDLRIFAVNAQGGVKIIINPFIYYKSLFNQEIGEEGCLSFPGLFGLVKRPKKIRLFYRDENGRLNHIVASGLLARVIQHETDHINGVLFIDKMLKVTKGDLEDYAEKF